MNNSPDHLNPSSRFDDVYALSQARRDAVTRELPIGSVIDRLEKSADAPTGVRFVGQSIAPADGPAFISWREIHDDARAVGAALQAMGIVPGDHVAILGPTSRELMTIIRGCWLAGVASMVLPLPMRMASLDAFVESTRSRIRHGEAKLVLIDDQLAAFYQTIAGDPPTLPMASVMPGPGKPSGERLELRS
jgi:fatty-acyl-CoA synthase